MCTRSGGVWISSSEVHFTKASRSMRLNVLANFRCCSWEQLAKVPPMISLMSVREMSTDRNLTQRSKATGPIQLKSAGRSRVSNPASKKQPSGMTRFGSCGLYSVFSQLIDRKLRHFSNARVWRRACGASWLLLVSRSPMRANAWRSSKAQHPKSLHPGAVTVSKGTIFQAD